MTNINEGFCEIIPAETSLKDNATFIQSSLDDAVKNIDKMLHNKRKEYLIWVLGDIAEFEDAAKHLEKNKDSDQAKKDLYKISHNMQGDGGMYGYPLVTEVLFFLNKYIDENQVVDKSTITIINLHIRSVKTIIHNKLSGNGGKSGDRLVSGLVDVVDKLQPES